MSHFALLIDGDPQRRNAFSREAVRILREKFSVAPTELSTDFAAFVYIAKAPAHAGLQDDGIKYDAMGSTIGLSFSLRPRQLRLKTDLLGLHPVYYWTQGETLLCASSPSLFPAHPAFRPALDEHGLALILMTMHSAGGRTLWRGVRRLPACTDLAWSTAGVQELALEWPSAQLVDREWPDLLREVDECLESGATEVPPDAAILLSGGMDSRILAGRLHELGKLGEAVTLGDKTDSEGKIARKVADTLGLEHHLHAVDCRQYPEWAQLSIDLDHCTMGATDFSFWSLSTLGLRAPIVSGFLGDAVMGGSHIDWAWDARIGEYNFSTLFRSLRRFGLPDATLRRLLRFGNTDQILFDAEAILADEFHSYAGAPFQKAWRYDLHHRQRNTIGKNVWRLALMSGQAIAPFAHPRLISLCATLPLAFIRRRKLQHEYLLRRFSDLARLPLDRLDFETRPLHVEGFSRRLLWAARKPMESRLGRWRLSRGLETRFFHRIFDFDTNPGWLAIRTSTRSLAEKTSDLFVPEVVHELVPPPAMQRSLNATAGGDPMIDTVGRKTLCGLVLWASRYHY